MKKMLLILALIFIGGTISAQKIDSIYFHLYTDSLKKGQYNYINIDGKTSDGKWLPLNSKQVILSCDQANFEGNELIIPPNFKEKKVLVKTVLRENPSLIIERTIWIKQLPDPPLKKSGRNSL